jgi:hypothetical protein
VRRALLLAVTFGKKTKVLKLRQVDDGEDLSSLQPDATVDDVFRERTRT